MTIVYVIHEAFRRDLKRLSAEVRQVGSDVARASQLQSHWTFVSDQLHHHHQVEDASLWPIVRPKVAGNPDEVATLAEMEAQHATLHPLCLRVDESFAALVDIHSSSAIETAAGRLDALADALGTHFSEEEARCFPIVDRAMTQGEFEAFGKATAKSIGMRGASEFFPWIFDGADRGERAAILSRLPPPLRILSGRVWEPRYEKKKAALWR
jgi:iron-sulfur cluster repair protein YtfE (RIC family)